MAGKIYPDIDLATHKLWSIYGYPKSGFFAERINERANSREEAEEIKKELKARGYTKLMIKPVKYQHDREYKSREGEMFKMKY